MWLQWTNQAIKADEVSAIMEPGSQKPEVVDMMDNYLKY